MEIKKIRIDSTAILVDYGTKQGDFRIKTTEEPAGSLIKAIHSLKNIFLRRMEFFSVEERVMVNGFEAGENDDGQWFRITGIYTANLVNHKMRTPKILHPGDAEEFWFDKDPDEYPSYLSFEETEIVEFALEEVKEFVQGRRDQLPLGLEDPMDEEEIYDFGN